MNPAKMASMIAAFDSITLNTRMRKNCIEGRYVLLHNCSHKSKKRNKNLELKVSMSII